MKMIFTMQLHITIMFLLIHSNYYSNNLFGPINVGQIVYIRFIIFFCWCCYDWIWSKIIMASGYGEFIIISMTFCISRYTHRHYRKTHIQSICQYDDDSLMIDINEWDWPMWLIILHNKRTYTCMMMIVMW